MRSIVVAVGSLFLMSASLGAQPSTNPVRTPQVEPASSIAAEPGAELTVYLLTMGPGDQVWEKFGHNAIWIHDAANSTDIAYHWGVFAFGDKDFYPNFIRGRMRYLMGAFDFNETIDAYRQSNRTVWAQELNLTPAQRYSLAQFVAWNVRPENRYYRYDYYRDNCSTRVRDALDGAVGGVIKTTFVNVPTSTTYRFHTERLTQDDWPIFTGTMAGLGQPTDQPITAYEEMFLPVKLKDHLQTLRVSSNGTSVPLVKSERVLFQATRAPEAVDVRRGITGYLVLSIVVILLMAGSLALKASGKPTLALSLIAVWTFVSGLGGVLLTGLWAFTDHVYSYRNENLFQLNPLSLIVLVVVVRLIASRPGDASWASRVASARLWSSIVAAISVSGFLLQILPMFKQVNGDIIALVMPIHIGAAAVLMTLSRRTQSDSRLDP